MLASHVDNAHLIELDEKDVTSASPGLKAQLDGLGVMFREEGPGVRQWKVWDSCWKVLLGKSGSSSNGPGECTSLCGNW